MAEVQSLCPSELLCVLKRLSSPELELSRRVALKSLDPPSPSLPSLDCFAVSSVELERPHFRYLLQSRQRSLEWRSLL